MRSPWPAVESLMASIRRRKESGMLMLDFRYHGNRCREQTLLPDTPANRARLQALGTRIERAINQGTFRYEEFFPDSRRAHATPVADSTEMMPVLGATPLFGEFAETWFAESEPRWRKRYR